MQVNVKEGWTAATRADTDIHLSLNSQRSVELSFNSKASSSRSPPARLPSEFCPFS